MNTLLQALDTFAAAWRQRHRCAHWMIQESDGPVCVLCGRAWLWRDVPGMSRHAAD